MFNRFILSILLLAAFQVSRAQTPAYPKVTGYFSIVQPLTTWTKDGFTSNFGNVMQLAFPLV